MKASIRLMERFGVSQALIGDLVEGAADRQTLWLRRQAIGAIAVALARDLRAHPIIVVRATILGYLLLELSRIPLQWMWHLLEPGFGALPGIGLEHQVALTYGFARTLMAVPFSFSIGWVVARLNRTRTPVALVAFLALYWYLAAPEFGRLAMNSVDQGRFRPYLALHVFASLAFTLSVIAGASLAAPRVDGTMSPGLPLP